MKEVETSSPDRGECTNFGKDWQERRIGWGHVMLLRHSPPDMAWPSWVSHPWPPPNTRPMAKTSANPLLIPGWPRHSMLAALGHFCEFHGPALVMVTQGDASFTMRRYKADLAAMINNYSTELQSESPSRLLAAARAQEQVKSNLIFTNMWASPECW